MREAVPAQKHRVPGGSDWRAGGVRGGGTKREAGRGDRRVWWLGSRLLSRMAWAQLPVLPLNSWVTFGKLLNHSVLQFPPQ